MSWSLMGVKGLTVICWIVIYPLDSVIHPMKNWALGGERYCKRNVSCPSKTT